MKTEQFTLSTTKRWLRLATAAVALSLLVLMGFVTTANAQGAEQVSGMGFFDAAGDCDDPVTGPIGQAPDFALVLTGDLEGCLYIFVESGDCTPSGVYHETGTEIYVGNGDPGNAGSFSTTYQFTAKYEDCPNFIGQINGRCQHPIVANSGTEDYEGVTGRLDFKDDVDAGNVHYKGHLKW